MVQILNLPRDWRQGAKLVAKARARPRKAVADRMAVHGEVLQVAVKKWIFLGKHIKNYGKTHGKYTKVNSFCFFFVFLRRSRHME